MPINRRLRAIVLLGAAATLAVGLQGGVSPAQAAGGDAPWCAVIDYGDGGVSWECDYRSFEECYPNVLAGNKGFCNVNPYGPRPNIAKAFTPHHTSRHLHHRHNATAH